MHSIRQSWIICRDSLYRTGCNCKLYVALFLMMVLFYQFIAPVREFSETVGIKVNGWLYPFLTMDKFIQVAIIVAIAFVLSDNPFDDGVNEWLILRTGRKNWIVGKISYTFMVSLLMSIICFLMSALMLIPQLQFENKWGKILGTLAQTNASAIVGTLQPDYQLQASLNPIVACLYSVLMTFAVMFLTGMLILLFNMMFEKAIGQLIGFGIAFLAMFAPNFSNLFAAYYFSPASWLNISFITNRELTKYPTASYIAIFLLSAITVTIVCSVLVAINSNKVIKKNPRV